MKTEDAHLFETIAEWACSHGALNLSKSPGCWERQVDPRWWVALNAHPEPTYCGKDASGGGGVDVPPFSAYVTYNGWPAGIVDPTGWQIAAGDGANEATFRAALAATMGAEVLS